MPLVSVVIPTYNRISTLPVSVDSVLRQTYNNLEVIVVDDGSTDGTGSFVRGLADGRVRYVQNDENRGPAAARNLGVRLAQGEYVAFQDSDDEWHPDKLEKQMKAMLDPAEKVDLVYCAYTRYRGQTRQETIPSEELPLGCKQGEILPVLLLQPLIGTPTIVVKKSSFVQTGGFNETLHTFEDYEFTVRFSQSYRIGFVEQSLVKVNDSPDSVDKRFADRVRTQAYIVRETIAALREYGLLWEKMSSVQSMAEHFKCHDVFLEELYGMEDLFLTEQERVKAAELAEKTERSDAKQNQRKEAACEALALAKQRLVETYVGIYGDTAAGAETLDEILRQTKDCVEECVRCFEVSDGSCGAFSLPDIQSQGISGLDSRLECLSLFADTVKLVEELERYIYGQRIECNVCGSRFYTNPSRRCPWCEADARDRLMIAFLQELQPEESEKLRVLYMASSRRVENYLLRREDIQCDSLDPETEDMRFMRELADETYDVLILPDLSSQTGNIGETLEMWNRLMKTGGICLAYPAVDRKWQERVEQIDGMELCVSEVGEEWFGTEYYQTHGIDRELLLTVFTRGNSLSEL